MAKSINYTVKLYRAHREGAFVVTKYEFGETQPSQEITAAGMDDLVEQITDFAAEHGEGCRASVRCHAPRKPPGFKKATEDLVFNLTDKPLGTASAA